MPAAIADALGRPMRAAIARRPTPPPNFTAGQPLSIQLSTAMRCRWVKLYYRHVNQAEDYETVDMTPHGQRLPRVDSECLYGYGLPPRVHFELNAQASDSPVLFPGFNEVTDQPYFVIRRA